MYALVQLHGHIRLFVCDVLYRSGGETQPSAPLPSSSGSLWGEDAGVRAYDSVPGVLGGSETLRQPAPPRQHDQREWQDSHTRESTEAHRLVTVIERQKICICSSPTACNNTTGKSLHVELPQQCYSDLSLGGKDGITLSLSLLPIMHAHDLMYA